MYNLSEDKHIFLHVTYSMLEEGYDIDEILGMWVLADEEKLSELMESLTLTEEIDLGNQDLEGITRYYFGERFKPNLNFNWLKRLFGKGQKIKPPKVKPTKPVTTAGGKPITQGGAPKPTTKPPKVTNSTTGTLADKVKKNVPKIVTGAAVVGGGLLGGSGLIPDEPGKGGNSGDRDSAPTDDVADTDKGKTEQEKAAEAEAKEEARKKAEAAKAAEAKSSSSNTKSAGWWRLQNQRKDLYKNSPGYKTSLKAYKNIRANPTPSIYDHYEVIADYLIKEGHASDIKEADYVMKQLDEEFIQSIIESSCGSHKKKKKKK
jgi:hypothetical protein